MMNRKYISIALVLVMISSFFAPVANAADGQWRSVLYPDNWTPEFRLDDGTNRYLQDFSYAGYHNGERPIPDDVGGIYVSVTDAPFLADNTGVTNTTEAIQSAIDYVEANGGGVVYLPEGTYRIRHSGYESPLKINKSNIILRGAGVGKTFIYNDNPNMRNRTVIEVNSGVANSWEKVESDFWFLSADVYDMEKVIPLENVYNLNVGDKIVLINDWTFEFIEEHDMKGFWTTQRTLQNGSPGNTIMYYRVIEAVDRVNHTITVDAPIRYFLKTRDSARVYKCPSYLEEVGIEGFSIGGAISNKPNIQEEDYQTYGNGAYDSHASVLIKMDSVYNGWVRNVNSFCHEENKTGMYAEEEFHFPSNGIQVMNSRGVTVENCVMARPQFIGGGGNGYMFTSESNECLFKDNISIRARHGMSLSRGYSSGNVILRHTDINSANSLDSHVQMSVANLYDGTRILNLPEYRTAIYKGGSIEACYRPYGIGTDDWGNMNIHGQTASMTVMWNTYGENLPSKLVQSDQVKYGYMIGSSGNTSELRNYGFGTGSSYRDTSPADYKEGEGKGTTLYPQSLYEDQFQKRLQRESEQARLTSAEIFGSKEAVSYENNQNNYHYLVVAKDQNGMPITEAQTNLELLSAPEGVTLDSATGIVMVEKGMKDKTILLGNGVNSLESGAIDPVHYKVNSSTRARTADTINLAVGKQYSLEFAEGYKAAIVTWKDKGFKNGEITDYSESPFSFTPSEGQELCSVMFRKMDGDEEINNDDLAGINAKMLEREALSMSLLATASMNGETVQKQINVPVISNSPIYNMPETSDPSPSPTESPATSQPPVPSETPDSTPTPTPSHMPQGGQSGSGGGGQVPVLPAESFAPSPAQSEEPTNVDFFSDTEDSFARESINYLAKKNKLNGENGLFHPDRNVTRAEFVSMLVKIFDFEPIQYRGHFSDVLPDDWFSANVEALYSEGIVTGFDGYFRPNDNITREEMSKITISAFGWLKEQEDVAFDLAVYHDSEDISDWAKEYVNTISASGIMLGNEKSEFQPKKNTTRAEAVTVLYRILKKSEIKP